MFSGIVEESASVVDFTMLDGLAKLTVQSELDHSRTKLGDSILINGVCLTVVKKEALELTFELALETLRRTTLGKLRKGDRVNLERSLALGDRLHGHFVFGHVDSVASLVSREPDGTCERLSFTMPKDFKNCVVTKGSISISGVSLTVGETSPDKFCVYIVPHTAEVTILSRLKPGDEVNIEVDMLARYVQASLRGAGNA